MKYKRILLLIFPMILVIGCSTQLPNNSVFMDQPPKLNPDYTNITIPFNIAPLNFRILEEGDDFITSISAENGSPVRITGSLVQIPQASWKKLLEENKGKSFTIDIRIQREGKWYQFQSITNHIAETSIDPWLAYRIVPPGYEHYCDITLRQRHLESFREETFYRATLVDEKNCANCHSFQNGKTNNFLFHSRVISDGTVFVRDGKVTKVNTKTNETDNTCTYPSWHPTLPLVAFSVNNTRQIFHSALKNRIEVFDFFSDLVLYDVEKHTISPIRPSSDESFETFPHWAPDGKTLYYSCAKLKMKHSRREMDLRRQEIDLYKNFKYNIMKVSFDPERRTFGEPEMVLDAKAMDKSAVFPRLSPDGRYLLYTLSCYGTFPIWHRDSDLWLLDLQTGSNRVVDEINSDESESYHSWSSSGRWIVFSSRRDDSLYTRLYISCFDPSGRFCKPFILPQKDPKYNMEFMRSYNVPELITERITISPSKLAETIKKTTAENAIYQK